MKSNNKKTFKKLATLGLLTVGCLMALTACSSDSGSSGSASGSSSSAASGSDKSSFTIWASGSDNVKIQFEKQVDQFNEGSDDYVAKLEFITSGTGAQSLVDRVRAAYLAGEENTSYDLIEVSDADIANFISTGDIDMFYELDETKISNRGTSNYSIPMGNDYVSLYRGTTVLLAYNSETVPNPPKTSEELYQWIEENPGRFAYNPPNSGGAGGSFVVTSVYNFLEEEALSSSDAAYKEQWDEGFELMTELHPYMYQSSGKVVYPNKNQGTLDLLANKEIDMTPAWADMVIAQQALGTIPESIQLTQLDPALTGQLVGLAAPKMGSNEEGAYAFMEYMLTPEAQNIALESMAALPVIDFDALDPELLTAISDLDIKEFRSASLGDLTGDLYEKWDNEIATIG